MAKKPFNNLKRYLLPFAVLGVVFQVRGIPAFALKRYLLPLAVLAVLLRSGAVPASAQLTPPTPVYPANGATGVAQAPGLKFYSVTGSTVQYRVQVDDDGGFGPPLYDYNQVSAQTFTEGMFADRDGRILVSSDAYLGASTATFTFYSSVTYAVPLSPNRPYWYRACVSNNSGVSYSGWSTPRIFTTGEFAQQFPMNSASISSVVLSSPTAAGTMNVTFHIRSNNVLSSSTFYGGTYNTAEWIFVKFSTGGGADWTWRHGKLTDGGSLTGSGATLTPASDKNGAYLNHTANVALWSSTVTLIWDYKASGALVKDSAIVKVFSIPMIKVPSGSFVYNAGGFIYSGHNNYGGQDQVTVGSVNDIPTGAAAGWPNGFSFFYIMRYQLTQGLYTDFLNNVPSGWGSYYYSASIDAGQKITYTAGNPYGSRYTAVYPNRAKNYLSNYDLWGFLSWSALRPMTEMEYQKASRDLNPDARKYPWGSDEPLAGNTTYYYSPPNEGGTHSKYYINFGSLTGGLKVTDVGRYMSGDIYRTTPQTGVSAYGIADLAGNVWQQIVYCSYLTAMSNGTGSKKYADNNWPTREKDAEGYYYVSIVGGSFENDPSWSKISLRTGLGSLNPYANRYRSFGGRGVRTP